MYLIFYEWYYSYTVHLVHLSIIYYGCIDFFKFNIIKYHVSKFNIIKFHITYNFISHIIKMSLGWRPVKSKSVLTILNKTQLRAILIFTVRFAYFFFLMHRYYGIPIIWYFPFIQHGNTGIDFQHCQFQTEYHRQNKHFTRKKRFITNTIL